MRLNCAARLGLRPQLHRTTQLKTQGMTLFHRLVFVVEAWGRERRLGRSFRSLPVTKLWRFDPLRKIATQQMLITGYTVFLPHPHYSPRPDTLHPAIPSIQDPILVIVPT